MLRIRPAWPSIAVLLGAVAVAAAPAKVTAASQMTDFTCPANAISEHLSGVADVSPSDAWAVGSCFSGNVPQTLAEHWNGTTWTQAATPDPSGSANSNLLDGVAALSASNVWAAGTSYQGSGGGHALILHWNGTTWRQAANPGTSYSSGLTAITAPSPSDAWVAGSYCPTGSCAKQRIFFLHWNGTAWTHVASPTPACPGGFEIYGMAATSASNAWAVGYCTTPATEQALILHWNGTSWARMASPPVSCPSGGAALDSVAATSPANAWAVGGCSAKSGSQNLIIRWNGTTWKRATSPNPAGSHGSAFSAVTALSATDAWAAGSYVTGNLGAEQTLIQHWNGTAWTTVLSPDPGAPGSQNILLGLDARSTSEAWAVGYYQPAVPGNAYTLAEHWNGTTWTHTPSP